MTSRKEEKMFESWRICCSMLIVPLATVRLHSPLTYTTYVPFRHCRQVAYRP